jgi:hypothetical protein
MGGGKTPNTAGIYASAKQVYNATGTIERPGSDGGVS